MKHQRLDPPAAEADARFIPAIPVPAFTAVIAVTVYLTPKFTPIRPTSSRTFAGVSPANTSS